LESWKMHIGRVCHKAKPSVLLLTSVASSCVMRQRSRKEKCHHATRQCTVPYWSRKCEEHSDLPTNFSLRESGHTPTESHLFGLVKDQMYRQKCATKEAVHRRLQTAEMEFH
jgi:hypothetical protein